MSTLKKGLLIGGLAVLAIVGYSVFFNGSTTPSTVPPPVVAKPVPIVKTEPTVPTLATEPTPVVLPAGSTSPGAADTINTSTMMGAIVLHPYPGAIDTWQTYTNKALSFAFSYPVHGSYAPHWDVTFSPEKGGSVTNGCKIFDNETPEYVRVGDTTFCHTSWLGNERGQPNNLLNEAFVTKIGKQYVVISFSDEFPAGKVGAKEGYQARMKDVISTFHNL